MNLKRLLRSGLLTSVLCLGVYPLHAEDAVKENATFPEDSTEKATAVAVEETPQTKASESIELDHGAMIEAIDIPTAEVLDAGTYGLGFRLYSDGGLLSRLLMSPFRRVQLGLSLDAQYLIGAGDPHMTTPSLYFKLRAFDGTDILPAIALGYDNQQYLFRRSLDGHLQDERGIYLVGSHEFLLPDLEVHGGVNIPKVADEADVYGFAGFTFRITPSFAFMTEYDNIRNGPENRVNIGGRFWVTPYFNIDVAARNVGRGVADGGERIVRLNYIGQFPF
jgi:hypothetical protein